MTEPRRPAVRLADVAAAAGVSTALVSIVVRGAPGASDATRARVLQVANDLGYRPDQRARLLRQQTPRVLGVSFEVQQAFHGDLVEGIYTAAETRGYEVVLSATSPGRPEARAIDTLLRDKCQALLLLGSHRTRGELEDLSRHAPVIVVARRAVAAGVDSVTADDERGAVLATEHLLALGHRSVVCLDGGRLPGAAERRRGYRTAMRRHGLTPALEPAGADEAAGAAAAAAVLARPGPPPTALLAFNDRCALGVLDTLLRAGVEVPRQMSVVGYDNSRLARIPYVDLTSVDQDAPRLAALAVDRALERAVDRSGPERHETVVPVLAVRGSTAGPPS